LKKDKIGTDFGLIPNLHTFSSNNKRLILSYHTISKHLTSEQNWHWPRQCPHKCAFISKCENYSKYETKCSPRTIALYIESQALSGFGWMETEQVAQLWQRDRASSAILRGLVTLRRTFKLKGYVSREYLWTVR